METWLKGDAGVFDRSFTLFFSSSRTGFFFEIKSLVNVWETFFFSQLKIGGVICTLPHIMCLDPNPSYVTLDHDKNW